MTRKLIISLALAAALPVSAQASVLEFPPFASLVSETDEAMSSYRLPIDAWDGSEVPAIWAEGQITRQAWQIGVEGITTLQMMAPLREQLREQGFNVLFECETDSCGGFDFRYETDILPEPDIHVNLGDFRFLSAQRMGEDRPEYVSLLISRSSQKGFIQVTRVGQGQDFGASVVTSTKNPDPIVELSAPVDVPSQISSIAEQGRVVLWDLEFETGSSKLGDGSFQSLVSLSDFLRDNPEKKVMLVGHTDAEGALSGNLALSRKRAESVKQRLVGEFGVSPEQLDAQGVGFLAPLAPNTTETGRTSNRRVEAVLASTQ